jgi:hypothetical protein
MTTKQIEFRTESARKRLVIERIAQPDRGVPALVIALLCVCGIGAGLAIFAFVLGAL